MNRRRLTEEEIKEILAMKKDRIRITLIAKKFHVEHSAIIYQLNKHRPFAVRCKIAKSFGRRFDDIEPAVKTYQDYLDDEQLRILEKQSVCEHKDCVEIIRCKCCGKVTYEDLL